MKILIFVKSMDGGTGTFVNSLLNITKHGENTTLKIIALERPIYRDIKGLASITTFFQEKKYPKHYTLSFLLLTLFIKELLWLQKIITTERPNIIITIDYHCTLLSSILKKIVFNNIKILATIHNNMQKVFISKSSNILSFLLRQAGKYFFTQIDTIVGISESVSDEFRIYFNIKKNVATIPHGINLIEANYKASEKLPANERELFSSSDYNIISIGRFESQKDFRTLIKAFFSVQKKISKAMLFLIGEGRERKKLRQLVMKNGLEKSVLFLGWKENVFPYLRQADIFVLSSFYEGFGWVLLEAMSQGLPIISTDAPFGPAEILGNGEYGLLVPMKDPAAMAKAIYQLIKNHKKYMYYSQQSIKRVKDFSLERMLNAYYQLFASVGKD